MPEQDPNIGIAGLAAGLGGETESAGRVVQALTTAGEVDAGAVRKLADGLANDPNVAKLQVFAGFLGGVVTQKVNNRNSTWQLLYLDPKLLTWLLVDVDALLFARNVPNQQAAFGGFDHIWVKADGLVGLGDGSVQDTEIESRYMRGGFVSAGDFATSVTGGTYAPPTGQLCPLTPGCCGIKTK